ncbi:hypothetical protein ACVWXO_008127 [Bradyrhizobium sp. LM2.7]
MTELFWDAATSAPALCAIGLVLLAAFVVAHVPLVERIWPQAYAYTKAAALIQVLAAALLFFLLGFRVSDDRAEARQLKNELAWREMELENQKATAEAAERLKQQAEAAADEAREKLNEFRTKYGDDPASLCAFTPDDLERLRQLGGAAGGNGPSALARLRAAGRNHR